MFDLFGNPSHSQLVDLPSEESVEGVVLPLSNLDERVEEEQFHPRQFPVFILLLIAVFTFLGVQAFRLQITQHSANSALAEGNSVRLFTVKADRGLIIDVNKHTLAQNTRQEALAINPQTLSSKRSERIALYQLLQQKAGISDELIATIEKNRTKSPEIFAIKTKLTKDESLLYKEWFSSQPGVVVQEIPTRQYVELPSLAQLMGYVGPVTEDEVKAGHTLDEQTGKTGLEESYESSLAGTPGKLKAEINAAGEIARTFSQSPESKAKPGQTLRLSIDSNLQTIVADALKHELERRTKKFGDLPTLGASAVVLDPATGAIKAMVSLPDYSTSLFAKGISAKEYADLLKNQGNPLLNRAIQGQYPSGSVLKPPIAAAGLQAGVITANTQMNTPEAITIGDFRFPDWKLHGQTNTRKAISESNDIFFYAVGGGWEERGFKGLGITRMNEYLDKFGFGKPLGIDLAGEAGGLLATPEWKQRVIGEPWYIGDTYHSSIGQGYTLATPLQIAAATAAIANGGTLWKPQLGWSLIDPLTNEENLLPHAPLSKDFISPDNMKVVREGMRMTVESGSARPLKTLKVTSAGKTGTAEFGTKNQTHAWYTGFAPYENPEIAFSILIEGGGESFYSSVPVAEEILRNYFHDPLAPGQKLNSEPDLTNSEFKGEH